MKLKVVLPIALIILVSFAVMVSVSALMEVTNSRDELGLVYNSEVNVNKGWNLISIRELDENSEISQTDILAIYYWNPFDKEYIRFYPESEEFKEIVEETICGDNTCKIEEREEYDSWCSADCSFDLSEDIVSNLNVLKEEEFEISIGERQVLSFNNHEIIELYLNQEYPDYTDEEGFRLFYIINGLENYHNFPQSTNDGNPNNDDFGRIRLITNPYSEKSRIFIKPDFGSSEGKFKLTVYEIPESEFDTDVGDVVRRESIIFNQPAWVYVEKSGILKTRTYAYSLENMNLFSGWNFITITPEMIGKSLKEISGSCDITKAVAWEVDEWDVFTEDQVDLSVFEEGTIVESGRGMLVKVLDDCALAQNVVDGANGSAPPSVPGL